MPTDAPDLGYDEASAPFFEGAARSELVLQFCDSCEKYMWPVKTRCIHCFSPTVGWRPASGRATLYSLSVVHQAYPGFESPYVVATVETAEGVRFNTALVGEDRRRGPRTSRTPPSGRISWPSSIPRSSRSPSRGSGGLLHDRL